MVEKSLDEFIDLLRSINLLSHFSDDQINSSLAAARANNNSKQAFLFNLPNLVYWIDSEYWWNPTVEASYEKVVQDLSSISRNGFLPTEVSVEPPHANELRDGERLAVSFSLNNESMDHKLNYFGDAFDFSLIEFVNTALLLSESEGQFYWYNTHDQSAILIFLTEAQFSVLKEIFSPDLRHISDMKDPNLMQELW